jgi:hypothetical protein
MSKRKPRRPKQISRSGRRGIWIITGVALATALAAVAVGVALVPHQTTLDNKVFFVIGAGLSAIVLITRCASVAISYERKINSALWQHLHATIFRVSDAITVCSATHFISGIS